MKLEQQVCSLELAKKLRELGCKQESYFYYTNREYWHTENGNKVWQICIFNFKDDSYCPSAFTVAELLELLPSEMGNEYYKLMVTKLPKDWLVEYLDPTEDGGHFWHKGWMAEIQDENAAGALAKMLIYLLENSLTTPNN